MRLCSLVVLFFVSLAFGQGVDVPAEVKLGARVELLRRNWPVALMVVIADSPSAYAQAIGEWSPERRFPVLLDDGSDAAREDIARFVRAFGAERVRLYSGTDDDGVSRELIERSAANAWGAENTNVLRTLWDEVNFTPPGVVVADETNSAWPAALALAAGRGQPIVWAVAPRGRIGSRLTPREQQGLGDAIEAQLRGWGWSWDASGDEIDAVTICLHAPTKATGGEDETLALTDVIGRSSTGGRWAWAGMVVGSESESAYRAMSALFLQPESAWLFNGYNRGGAFAAYDMDPAAEILQQAGMNLLRSGRPAGGRADWSIEGVAGVDAGLIFVNSSGTRRRFDLAPGRSLGVDIPLLHVPSAVHFIHSFSAQNLNDRASIARAWLDQGAFVYVGSVDEPYLTAFVTPGLLARRLLAPAPIGAAARVTSPPWKVNVLGDPLYTAGPPAPLFEGGVDFEGLRSAEDTLSGFLADKDFDGAGRLLALLGRDDDLIALAQAVLADDVADVGSELAAAALLAAVRARDAGLVGRLWTSLTPAQRQGPRLINPVWHLIEPVLGATDDGLVVGVAASGVRHARYAQDAKLAARATARLFGDQAAADLIQGLMESAPNEKIKRELAKEFARY